MTLLNRCVLSFALVVLLAHGGVLSARQSRGRQSTPTPPAAGPATPSPISAAGTIELTDPAGDVGPIIYLKSVGTGPETEVKYPGFDVTKLVVSSDGKALSFAATLTAPPAKAAQHVVEFYIDADNNKKTGITHPDDTNRLAGLEFVGTLQDCLELNTFGMICSGTDEKPLGHSAVVTLEKYGKDWYFKDTLVSWPAAGAVKPPTKTPVKGAVVQASIDYAAMGLKPGQVIRLVIREYCTAKAKNVMQGFFPEIVLALK